MIFGILIGTIWLISKSSVNALFKVSTKVPYKLLNLKPGV